MKITVCGSIAFYNEMEKLKKILEKNGHEVYIPLLNNEMPTEIGSGNVINFDKYVKDNGGMDAFSIDHKIWDLKEKAIRDHYSKIEWCDAIIVSNHEKKGIAGYIGGNTLIEIGLAFFLKKTIYIMNPISPELSYRQEIYGMKPIFLNGDVNLVK